MLERMSESWGDLEASPRIHFDVCIPGSYNSYMIYTTAKSSLPNDLHN